jgi:TonB-linked SusC/RagA family outer membrane protein
MKTKFNGILTLLLALVVQITFAQSKIISGIVSDDSGPLPGVSIIIKGTTTGAETDFDGNYSIQASTGDVLQYSFIGMSDQSITVGASNNINVVMEANADLLNEVVITGYGIARQKKTLTYQAEAVSDEELIIAAPTRAASALAGKVAGLQINNRGNGVNSGTTILLRGVRSITSNNQALIVIDGSIATIGAFDDLNPNDIQSLNVLKGANAAAIYGADAANGAIIVITKKGKRDSAFTVAINSSATFEDVAYLPDFQSKFGLGWQGAYDPIENTNWGPRFDGQIRQIGPTFADGTFQSVPYSPIANNLRDFYATGTTYQNSVSLNGGDETSTFYISIGDQETDGIVPDDKYSRNTFRVNASKQIGDLTLSLSSNYLRDKTNVVGSSIGDQDRPLYWFVLNTAVNIPLTSYSDWDNPQSFGYADNYYNAYYQNPYWGIGTNRDIDSSNRLTANVAASWDVKDWLNLTTRFGINNVNGRGKNWRAAQAYDPILQPAHQNVSSFVTDSEFSTSTYTLDAIATANFDITEDIDLIAIGGATNWTQESSSSSINAQNLSIPDFYDVSNGTGQPIVGRSDTKERNYAFFTDLTFGYKDFLYLNVSGRNDWTSTLPKDQQSYFYPAGGLSFIASEAFPTLTDGIISYAKFTASNSTVYNDLSAKELNEVYVQSGGFPFGSVNGFTLQGTAIDASIVKERLNTTEFGTDLTFFDNRLTLSASYYITNITDNLTSAVPSATSGASGFRFNIGEIESKGYEVTLGGTLLKSDDFSWNANINIAGSEAIIKDIGDGVTETPVSTSGTVGVYAVVGEVFPQIKATSYVRDPQGRIVVDGTSGNPIQGELKNLGKVTPDYTLGFTSSINYKGLSLAVTMDYRTGHVYYAQGSDAMEFTGRSVASASANREDFVLPNSVIETSPGVFVENTNLTVTDGRQDYWNNTYNEIKENYVRDATAFKIREIALNYTLPSSFLEKTPLSAVRLGLIARNPLTVLPEENRFSDPEFNNSAGNAIGIGGYFQSPPTQSYGFNINVEF